MQNGLIESESNIEQNLQLAAQSHGDIEVKGCKILARRKKFSHPVPQCFRCVTETNIDNVNTGTVGLSF